MTAALRDLSRRIRMMFARAVVRAVNDAAKMQTLQVVALADEVKDGVEHPQPYGFTAHPHAGAEAFVAFVGGNRDHGIVLVVDDRRYRLKGLQPGEVALYTDEGDTIVLRRNRVIEIDTATLVVRASAKARFETPQLEVTGEIVDRVNAGGRSMSGMRQVYNAHTHPDAHGGSTGAPGQGM